MKGSFFTTPLVSALLFFTGFLFCEKVFLAPIAGAPESFSLRWVVFSAALTFLFFGGPALLGCLRKLQRIYPDVKDSKWAKANRATLLLAALFPMFSSGLGAQITGTVFLDINSNGTQQTSGSVIEPGIQGITVTAYNAANTAVATGSSGATGGYAISVPAGSYRLEFTWTDPYLKPGVAGGTTVQFVTAPVSNINCATHYPFDYFPAGNTSLGITCFDFGDVVGAGVPMVVTFPETGGSNTIPASPTGTIPAAYSSPGYTMEIAENVSGSVWGLAFDRPRNQLLAGAFVKRHSRLGNTGNPTTIYKMTPGADAANGVWLTLDPSRANPHGTVSLWQEDYDVYNDVLKEGLGDIDINEDYTKLYAIDMGQRKLWEVPINSDGTPGTAVSYNITTTIAGCPAADVRPMGLEINKGKVYIGMICSGQSTVNTASIPLAGASSGSVASNTPVVARLGDPSTLKGYIYEWTGGTSYTQLLNFPLNYDRGCLQRNFDAYCERVFDGDWTPWVDQFPYDVDNGDVFVSYPQPIISDIDFEDDGDMIIVLNDRLANQLGKGARVQDYDSGFRTVGDVFAAGDVLHACKSGSTWILEEQVSGNAACGTAGTSNNVGGTKVIDEFYFDDDYAEDGYDRGRAMSNHGETTSGGAVQVPGRSDVMIAAFDPVRHYESATYRFGVNWFNNTTGAWTKGYLMGESGEFGKAAAVGDLVALAPPPPIELGNYVWLESCGAPNGIQDPGEAPIANVSIQLFADFDNNGTPDGAALGTTTTSATGNYYFNQANVVDGDPTVAGNQAGPQPNKRYLIRIGSGDWSGGIGIGDLAGFVLTTANVGGAGLPDLRDSDAGLSGGIPTISVLTGAAGANDHTLDFGFVPSATGGTIAADQTICSGGDPAAFTSVAAATGTGTLSYQWESSTTDCNTGFTDIAGATSATYNPPAGLSVTTYYRRTATFTSGGSSCEAYSNCVTVTVNNPNGGTVGSDQTICSGGDPVAFTNNVAASGSGTLTYQWQSSTTDCTTGFSNIASANAATYNPPSGLTQTTYYRRVATYVLNGATCTANSNCITVTVNTVAPGTVAGDQTICSGGNPAAFTSPVGATGSGTRVYQWQSSTTNCTTGFTDISGATAATYDVPAGLTQTTYYRRKASYTFNGVVCEDYTNCLTVTVNNATPGSISGDQTVCSGGDPAAFTSVAATGGGAITYQWQSSTVDCSSGFSDIATATAATYNPPAGITQTTYYRRKVTSTLNSVACEAYSNCLTVTVNVVTGGTVGADQTICSGGDPVAFTSIAAGTAAGAVTYQWQSSTTDCASGFTNIASATAATYNVPAGLTQTTYYRRVASYTLNGQVCTANSNCITVTVNTVSPGTIGNPQTVCAGGDPAALTNTLSGTGAGTIAYQWEISTTDCTSGFSDISGATSATYNPPSGIAQTSYYRRVTTSTLNGVICESTSNCIEVTVNPLPTLSVVSTICSIDLSTYTITFNSTGTVTSTAGTVSGNTVTGITSGTNVTLTATLNGCVRTLSVTAPNCACPPIGAPTSGGNKTICQGQTIPALTVTVGVGQTADWYSASSGGMLLLSGSLSYTPVAAGTYYAEARNTISGCLSSSRTPVTLTINPLPSASISGGGTICIGGSIILTASGGGTYSWSNGGALASITVSPAVTTLYTVTVTSAQGCTAVASATVTVNNVNGGAIGSDQTLCSPGDPAAFTSITAASGSGTRTYQWQLSTTDCTTGFTDIVGANAITYNAPAGLTQTTYYRRQVTHVFNGVTCIEYSNCVTVTVNTVVPGTVSGDETICSGGDPAAFTSTAGATGSGTRVYQWQSSTTNCTTGFTDISGATAATYNPPSGLTTTTYYRRKVSYTLNSVVCEAFSNCITVTVNNIVPGTIGADQTVCTGGDPAAFTSITGATGSGTLTYQWQLSTTDCTTGFNDIVGATLATYNAPTGLTQTTYYRRVAIYTLNGVVCEAASNCVTVTVNTVTGGTVGADQTLCEGGDPAAFTSIAAGTAAGAVSYQWESSTVGCSSGFANIAGATGITYNPPAGLMVTTYYRRRASYTLNGQLCTAYSNCVTVTVNTIDPGTIGSPQTICSGGDPAAFTSVAGATGSGTRAYQWERSTVDCNTGFSAISGATAVTYNPPAGLTQTTYYRRKATYTFNGVVCEDVSNCITVTVTPLPTLTILGTSCSVDLTTYSVTFSSNGTVTATSGSVSGSTVTGIPTGTSVVLTATLSGCTNAATVAAPNCSCPPVTPPVSGGNKEICQGEAIPSLTVTVGAGETADWYDAASGGTLVAMGSLSFTPVLAGTYYAQTRITVSGCTSTTRTGVTLTINALPVAAIVGDNILCNGESTTLTASGGTQYSWNTLAVTASITVAPTTTTTYTVTVTNAEGCTDTETITVTVNPKPSIPNASSWMCIGDVVDLTNFYPSYNTYVNPLWTIGTAAGAPVPNPMAVSPAATTLYVLVAENASMCKDTATVNLQVNNPTGGTVTADQTICSGGDPAAFASVAAATGSGTRTYQWQMSTTDCTTGFTDIIGATAVTYNAPAGLTQTTYYRRKATYVSGSVSCVAYSNCITVTVNTVNPGTIAADQTVCVGDDPAAFTSTTGASGSGTLVYQWEISTTDCLSGFSDISGANSATYNPPSGITQTTYYRRLATYTLNGVSCEDVSNCVTVTVNPVDGGIVGTVVTAPTVCEGGDPAAFTNLAPATGPGVITYQWQSSTVDCNSGFSDIGGANAVTYDPPSGLMVTTYYRRKAISTDGAVVCEGFSNCIIVTVNIINPGTIGNPQTVCAGADPSILSNVASATGSGTRTYQWERSTTDCNTGFAAISGATAATYNPPTSSSNVTSYYRRKATYTFNGIVCEEYSNCITVTVTPLPTLTVSGTTCSMDLTTYTVAFTSNGTVTATAGTVVGSTVTGVPSGTNVTLTATLSGCTRTAIVTAPNCTCPTVLPPVSGGDQAICDGAVIPALTVTVGVGETADWYDAASGGTTLATGTTTYTPTMEGTYYAETRIIVSGCVSTTRTAVTLTINPQPIAAITGDNVICNGESTTLTASGGSVYAWNTLATTASITVAPTITTTYTVTVSNTEGCLDIESITVTVNAKPNIPNTSRWMCIGDVVDITALYGSYNTYINPVWTVGTAAGALVGDPTMVSPVATTLYVLVAENGSGCKDTATVNLQVNNPMGGTVSGDRTVCSGGDPAAFTNTAHATGSGTRVYQWQSSTVDCNSGFTDIALATAATYNPPAGITQTTYYRRRATYTSGTVMCVAYSNCLVVTVNNVTPGSIAGDQSICTGGDPAAFTSPTAATGSGTQVYQWEMSTTDCTTGFTDIVGANAATYDPPSGLTQTTHYRRVVSYTLNGVVCEATSNCLTVTVNTVTGGTISAAQTICEGGDPDAFASTAAGAGPGVLTYQWEMSTTDCNGGFVDISGAMNDTYDPPSGLMVTTYYRRRTISTDGAVVCEAYSNCVIVTVNIIDPGTIGNPQTLCQGSDPGVLTSVAAATGSGTRVYQWERSTTDCTTGFTAIAGATGTTYNPPVSTGNVTRYYRRKVTYTLNSVVCEEYSNCITVTIVPPVSAGADGITTICDNSVAPIDLYGLITGETTGGVWTRVSGSGGSFDSGLGQFTPAPGATSSIFQYAVTATAPCPDDQSYVTVNIIPQANAGTDGSTAVCESSATPIVLAALLTGEQPGGVWTRMSGSGGSFNTLSGTFTPALGATTSTFQYVVTGASPCPNDASMVTVTVNTIPVVTLNDPSDVCVAGADLNFTATPAGGLFKTSALSGLTANNAAGTAVLDVSAAGAGTYTVTYTYTNLTGCVDSQMVSVTIHPNPTIVATSNSPVCEGFGISLNSTPSGGTAPYSYAWSGPGGYSSTVQHPGRANAALSMVGAYTVTITDANSCSAMAATSVAVIDRPDITTTNLSICRGATVNLSTLVTNAGGGVLSYHYTLADANNNTNPIISGIVTPTVATNYYVRSQVTNNGVSCYTVKQVTVTFKPGNCAVINVSGPSSN